MNILLIGCVESSYIALKSIVLSRHKVVGVITKKESVYNTDYVDLTDYCNKNNIDVFIWSKKTKDLATSWTIGKHPDLGLCIGWSELLNDDLIKVPQFGFVGYHPAYLPMNRGRNPIVWTIFLGLSQTASTLFFLNKTADAGDIISQVPIFLDSKETARTLYSKILNILPDQIIQAIDGLENKTIIPQPQEHKLSNNWRKRCFNDGVIDWRMSAIAIVRLVRALTKPYPGATIIFKNNNYQIWEASLVKIKKKINIEPGHIINVNKENGTIDVAAYDRIVRIFCRELSEAIEMDEYLL